MHAGALPISALEHHEYCPRQCALIHADGFWEDNEHTVRGTHGHRRVDSGASRMERRCRVLRGIPLWSERLMLTGRADVVELHEDGTVVPVEYKVGSRHGLTADVQLCAQTLCLEEMLAQPIEYGFLWYSSPRRRHRVAMDEALRRLTVNAIQTVQATVASGTLPVAVDDARCDQCQLVDHCLPALTSSNGPARLSRYVARELLRCGS